MASLKVVLPSVVLLVFIASSVNGGYFDSNPGSSGFSPNSGSSNQYRNVNYGPGYSGGSSAQYKRSTEDKDQKDQTAGKVTSQVARDEDASSAKATDSQKDEDASSSTSTATEQKENASAASGKPAQFGAAQKPFQAQFQPFRVMRSVPSSSGAFDQQQYGRPNYGPGYSGGSSQYKRSTEDRKDQSAEAASDEEGSSDEASDSKKDGDKSSSTSAKQKENASAASAKPAQFGAPRKPFQT